MLVHEVVYMRHRRYGKYRRSISLKTISKQKPICEKSYGREKSIARKKRKVRHSHPLKVRALR